MLRLQHLVGSTTSTSQKRAVAEKLVRTQLSTKLLVVPYRTNHLNGTRIKRLIVNAKFVSAIFRRQFRGVVIQALLDVG